MVKLAQHLYIVGFLIVSHDLHDKEGNVGGDCFLAYLLNELRKKQRLPFFLLES